MLKRIGSSYNKEERTHNWEYAFFCAFARKKKKVLDPVLISAAVLACQGQDVDS